MEALTIICTALVDRINIHDFMFKQAYYRIFYCLYVGLKRSSMSSGWVIAFSSAIMFSILLCWNVVALACILTLITHRHFLRLPLEWSLLAFTILNSIIFLPKKRYLKVEAMFANEEKTVRNRRRFWCVVYIVLSGISVSILYYILGKTGLWYYNPQ